MSVDPTDWEVLEAAYASLSLACIQTRYDRIRSAFRLTAARLEALLQPGDLTVVLSQDTTA